MASSAEKRYHEFSDVESLIAHYNDPNRPMSFSVFNGMRITEINQDGLVGEMPLSPEKYNENNVVHGGILFSLADSLTGVASFILGTRKFGGDLTTTTVNANFNYLRAIRSGSKVTCKATCRKLGRSIAVMEASVFDEDGVEACSGTFTMHFVDRARFQQR